MKKILVLFVVMFMTILSGCSMGKEEIEHTGRYYFKEFYVDVVGTSGGYQYVDYTLRYTKSACINYDGDAFEGLCDLLLLGDEFYLDVTDSMMNHYMNGEKQDEEAYVLREDLVFILNLKMREILFMRMGIFLKMVLFIMVIQRNTIYI